MLSPAARRTRSPTVPEEKTVVIPRTASTLKGFRQWCKSPEFPERGNISFLRGNILIDMSPERIETHVLIKGEIAFVLESLSRKEKSGRFLPDGTRLVHIQAGLSCEPDGLFLLWSTLESQKVRLIEADGGGGAIELEGSPDCVIEIVSAGSVAKDTQELKAAYFQAGIPEYWLIDARSSEVKFAILNPGPTGYQGEVSKSGWVYSSLFQRKFRLVRGEDRAGLVSWKLEVRKR